MELIDAIEAGQASRRLTAPAKDLSEPRWEHIDKAELKLHWYIEISESESPLIVV